MSIHKLDKVLAAIRKDVSGDLNLATLQTFLFIAQRGRCTQKDVEDGLGLTHSATSRNVSYWTERRYDRREGMRFIARCEGDYDRRYRELTLTNDGRAFYHKIRGLMA